MSSIAIDQEKINHVHLVAALTDPEKFAPTKSDLVWLEFIRELPQDLREILREEVLQGNVVYSIQLQNWPTNRSIYVCLVKNLRSNYSNSHPATKYRLVNDPHYWIEEVGQTVNGIEHLIIR